MPPQVVYSVDFSNGNLFPGIDLVGWGAMQLITSSGAIVSHAGDSTGLNLTVTRNFGDPQQASHGVYVLPPPSACKVQARLRLRAEFDRPNAKLLPMPEGLDPATWVPEPWAVGLFFKLEAEEVYQQPMAVVTCQFNRRLDGVRLNTPGSLQRDEAKVMLSPLDYQHNLHKRYVLEHAYAGYNVDTVGHTAGSGALKISGVTPDQRVYSSKGLTTGQRDWFGALGISLVTIDGIGRLSVRLRTFSVEAWS